MPQNSNMAISIDAFSCEIENIIALSSDQNGMDQNLHDLTKEFQTVEMRLKDQVNRDQVPESLFLCVRDVLGKGLLRLESPATLAPVLTQCFRCLRNACVNSTRNQEMIARQVGILEATYSICKNLKSKLYCPDCILVLRCAVQFLGNFVVQNKKNQEDVWRGLKPVLWYFVSCNDEKLPHYTCMVLHTCISGLHQDRCELEEYLKTDVEGKELVTAILDSFRNGGSEWMLFVVEDFLSIDGFWDELGCLITPDNKLAMLEIASQLLGGAEEVEHKANGSCLVAESNLMSLAQEFATSAHQILELKDHSPYMEQNTDIILKELEVLCLVTSKVKTYPKVRNDRNLLKSALGVPVYVSDINLPNIQYRRGYRLKVSTKSAVSQQLLTTDNQPTISRHAAMHDRLITLRPGPTQLGLPTQQ